MFLLDGSGSLGEAGWKAEIVAAQRFVDAFAGTGAQAQMGVILYSGPRTWSGVNKCFARNGDKVDIENTCKIKTVTHFTTDMKKVKDLIGGHTRPPFELQKYIHCSQKCEEGCTSRVGSCHQVCAIEGDQELGHATLAGKCCSSKDFRGFGEA